MKTLNKYVGLDVHKDATVIAVADEGRQREDGVARAERGARRTSASNAGGESSKRRCASSDGERCGFFFIAEIRRLHSPWV